MKKIKDIISQMTLEDKVSFLSGKNFWQTMDMEKPEIKSMFLADGPNGVRRQEAAAGQGHGAPVGGGLAPPVAEGDQRRDLPLHAARRHGPWRREGLEDLDQREQIEEVGRCVLRAMALNGAAISRPTWRAPVPVGRLPNSGNCRGWKRMPSPKPSSEWARACRKTRISVQISASC